MTVAALYDIHGNLPALEAILDEISGLSIDQIIIGGDVILGPMSRECLDRLSEITIPVHYIFGNCEVAILNIINNQPLPNLPQRVLEDMQWTAKQMSEKQAHQMSQWPKTLTIDLPDIGKVLFCHATPEDENENFTRLSSEEKLTAIFENVDADVVVCGHTHMQFDKMIGDLRVINAGSVGMPFGKPGAYWLLFDSELELRYTSYDLEKAADQIKKTDYPNALEFAKSNVIKPPTEEAMLKVLS